MTLAPVYKGRVRVESGRHGKGFQLGIGEHYMSYTRGTSIVAVIQFWEWVVFIELFNHKPKKEIK